MNLHNETRQDTYAFSKEKKLERLIIVNGGSMIYMERKVTAHQMTSARDYLAEFCLQVQYRWLEQYALTLLFVGW
jgi:hypothetical protein